MIARLSPARWRHGRPALAVAGGYVLLFAALFAFVLLDTTRDHPDASLAGVLLYLVTLPLSLAGILAVPDSTGPLATAVLLGVPSLCLLIQATGLWLALRGRPTGAG